MPPSQVQLESCPRSHLPGFSGTLAIRALTKSRASVGGVQGGAPRRYPRRTRRNSGKHLRKRKATSNIQRDTKRRRDQLLTGGCKEQTQDQQKESPGKEVCENRWPCKGMSSPSLERILAGKGPRSPPWPPTQSGRASSPMASGHCPADTRGSFQLQPPRQRPQRVGTVH